MNVGGIRPHQRDQKGKQVNPYGKMPMYVYPNMQVAASSKKKKKKKDDIPKLQDYKSDEIKMFENPIMYSDGPNVDDKDVEKACLDLAIDG